MLNSFEGCYFVNFVINYKLTNKHRNLNSTFGKIYCLMETYLIIILCLAAFAAGFIDAIVGGGGLIQTPVGLIMLPNLPVSTVIGTLKIPA